MQRRKEGHVEPGHVLQVQVDDLWGDVAAFPGCFGKGFNKGAVGFQLSFWAIHAGSTFPWFCFSVLRIGPPLSFQCSGGLSGCATSPSTKGHTTVYNWNTSVSHRYDHFVRNNSQIIFRHDFANSFGKYVYIYCTKTAHPTIKSSAAVVEYSYATSQINDTFKLLLKFLHPVLRWIAVL